MWIHSEPGKGTLVGFTLPLPTQGERLPLGTVRSSTAPGNANRPLVLLIHDDPRTLSLLRRHIDGCDFAFAEDAAQARTLMLEERPNIVLVESGSINQWEAMVAVDAAVGATPFGATPSGVTPLLVAPLPSVHHFGALLGASDYLPKPVTRDECPAFCAPAAALCTADGAGHRRRPAHRTADWRMLRAIAPDVHVLEAFGGEEGLDIARSHSPDIVFIDLMMPGMSGQQFISAAARERHLAGTPIVVVSVRSIEQENAPLLGDVVIRRAEGFACE